MTGALASAYYRRRAATVPEAPHCDFDVTAKCWQ